MQKMIFALVVKCTSLIHWWILFVQPVIPVWIAWLIWMIAFVIVLTCIRNHYLGVNTDERQIDILGMRGACRCLVGAVL